MYKPLMRFADSLLYPLYANRAASHILRHLANKAKHIQEKKICREIAHDGCVMAGFFKGLKYAIPESAGSSLIPKLAGTYEDELAPVFEKIAGKSYSEIVDIGSAEGFYAIGLARKYPVAKVFAYDNDPHARFLCQKNAQANCVENTVSISTFIDAAMLANFPFGKKGLIICDCEGFEAKLFTAASVPNLKKCDLIIELHDPYDKSISPSLLPLFRESHTITIIDSIPRKKVVDYNHLTQFKSILADEMLDERGGLLMQWVFLESIQ